MAAATSVIAASHPDLLLLDIRLRGATAFDLLRELEESPLVIFTTAYDEFALEAFQVASVDYLLKPVDSEGLGRALEKVRRYHSGQRQADLLERVQRLVERSTPAAAEGFLRRLGIRIGDRTLVLPIEEVTHFYAQDKLVYAATTAAKSHIVDSTLVQTGPSARPTAQFIRIHRATLVNIRPRARDPALVRGPLPRHARRWNAARCQPQNGGQPARHRALLARWQRGTRRGSDQARFSRPLAARRRRCLLYRPGGSTRQIAARPRNSSGRWGCRRSQRYSSSTMRPGIAIVALP